MFIVSEEEQDFVLSDMNSRLRRYVGASTAS